MSSFPLAALFFFVLLLPVYPQRQTRQRDVSEYIGYSYSGVIPGTTLPNGVKYLGGGLIGDINSDPVYGISQTVKGNTRMLWLEVSTGRNAEGIAGWKVLDVLSFQSILKSEQIFFADDPSIYCSRRGSVVPNLVGRGRAIRKSGRFVPSMLWVANIQRKKFEPISLRGISCDYSEP